MKICLTYNLQNIKLLEKADEIRVPLYKANDIIDLAKKYPIKTFILDTAGVLDESLDWNLFNKLNIITQNNLVICVYSLRSLKTSLAAGLRAYIGYPINSFCELKIMVDNSSEYIIPGQELFFNLDKVKPMLKNSKLKIFPDVAILDDYPYLEEDAPITMWVRPEDLWSVYEKYIDTIEFHSLDEPTMFNIYCDRKEWRQDLSVLIQKFNYHALGRLIPSELAEVRTKCSQKCLKGSHCRLCYNAMKLAVPRSDT